MPFEIQPGRYYLAMWYFDLPSEAGLSPAGNFTALAHRPMNDPEAWTLQYRFRYYRGEGADKYRPFNHPDDPMRTQDEFSWYRATLRCGEAEIGPMMAAFITKIEVQFGVKAEQLVLRGGYKRVMRILTSDATRPEWMAMKAREIVPDDGHAA